MQYHNGLFFRARENYPNDQEQIENAKLTFGDGTGDLLSFCKIWDYVKPYIDD